MIYNMNERNKSQEGLGPKQGDSSLKEKRSVSEETRSGIAFPLNLLKGLKRKSRNTGPMSTGSNSGGSADNSDNSALVSFGNDSFGFNFDSEDAMMNSSSDGDGSGGAAADVVASTRITKTTSASPLKKPDAWSKQSSVSEDRTGTISNKSGNSGEAMETSLLPKVKMEGHDEAAAAAVANLKSIASQFASQPETEESSKSVTSCRKRKMYEDTDSGGYNSDDEGADSQSRMQGTEWSKGSASFMSSLSTGPTLLTDEQIKTEEDTLGDDESQDPKKKGKVQDNKREERNAREKERSFRISRQIDELRSLLSSGGVIVPKGTKSSVLSEAANYIRMLQQHQYRSEIDRHQLIQQMQIIGGGALGPQAASAIRHVSAQNGVWSLGNFGGVPPRSAMTAYQQSEQAVPKNEEMNPNQQQPQSASQEISLVTKVEDHEYRYIFNCSSVGTGIASMGGAFIDCNPLFCQLSQYSKQEVCSMTIFNLTSRTDLQHAFDLISQMISPPLDNDINQTSLQCVLRGSMKHRNDLGLSISLIKGEDGIAKCFCVTLIKNPASPFDTSTPVPATADFLQSNLAQVSESSQQPSFPEDKSSGISLTPAYTTG